MEPWWFNSFDDMSHFCLSRSSGVCKTVFTHSVPQCGLFLQDICFKLMSRQYSYVRTQNRQKSPRLLKQGEYIFFKSSIKLLYNTWQLPCINPRIPSCNGTQMFSLNGIVYSGQMGPTTTMWEYSTIKFMLFIQEIKKKQHFMRFGYVLSLHAVQFVYPLHSWVKSIFASVVYHHS